MEVVRLSEPGTGCQRNFVGFLELLGISMWIVEIPQLFGIQSIIQCSAVSCRRSCRACLRISGGRHSSVVVH